MAKASTGRTTQGKAKAAPPAATLKKSKATAKPEPAAKISVTKKAPAAKVAAPSHKTVSAKQGTVTKKTTAKAKAVVPAKAGPPARPVAVKQATIRRPAPRMPVATPAARRARIVAAPRKAPVAAPRAVEPAAPRPVKAHPPQAFAVSHLNQNDFKTDGLRSYALYRDLGMALATGGLCQAHVIRFVPPCTEQVRKRHTHQAELQLVYVLQGWMKNEFEGHGEQMMSAGSCWLQPAGIKHTVLDYSADCEVLEIVVPADFTTSDIA